MIINGKNLIISADGVTLAASKSCTVNVDVSTQKVSSPTDGQWDYSVPGRKSWSVTTNHLVPFNPQPSYVLNAYSTSFNGKSIAGPTAVIVSNAGRQIDVTGRGVTVVLFEEDWSIRNQVTFDTYEDSDMMQSEIAELLGSRLAGTGLPWSVVTRDAFSLTESDAAAMKSYLSIDFAPVVNKRRVAWAAVGIEGKRGISHYTDVEGATARAMMYLQSDLTPMPHTPLKDSLAMVGRTVQLRMELDGLTFDALQGKAICRTCQTTAAVNGLMQGSYSFEGTGPLT